MLGALLAAWLATRLAVKYGKTLMSSGCITLDINRRNCWRPPVACADSSCFHAGSWMGSNYYFTHPLDALAIWNGGLGIPGAVIGGALALYIYCRKTKINFGIMTDMIAPGLALGQAIGRWGNFINQELYGAPSNLPGLSPLIQLTGFRLSRCGYLSSIILI
jgi:phosphatidylglycerol:prolipoprotein diacylglycerol transferase